MAGPACDVVGTKIDNIPHKKNSLKNGKFYYSIIQNTSVL
jgi:hypothetical protein